MRLNIQRKILILTIAVLLFALGTNTLITLLQFQEDYRYALQTKVVIIGKNLRCSLKDVLALGFTLDKLPGVNERCRYIVERYEEVSYCYIVDTDMRILYHNDQAYVGKILREPTRVNSTEEATIHLYSLNGDEFYDIALPVFDKESNYLGSIRLEIPVQTIRSGMNKMVRNSFLLMLISFIVATLLSFYLAKSLTKPLRHLTEGVEAISEGNLDYIIEIKGEDEIGQLAIAFNEMTRDLKEYRAKLDEYNRELEGKVKERTKELQARVDELERFHKLTVGRELKMVELKKMIKELEENRKGGI